MAGFYARWEGELQTTGASKRKEGFYSSSSDVHCTRTVAEVWAHSPRAKLWRALFLLRYLLTQFSDQSCSFHSLVSECLGVS